MCCTLFPAIRWKLTGPMLFPHKILRNSKFGVLAPTEVLDGEGFSIPMFGMGVHCRSILPQYPHIYALCTMSCAHHSTWFMCEGVQCWNRVCMYYWIHTQSQFLPGHLNKPYTNTIINYFLTNYKPEFPTRLVLRCFPPPSLWTINSNKYRCCTTPAIYFWQNAHGRFTLGLYKRTCIFQTCSWLSLPAKIIMIKTIK